MKNGSKINQYLSVALGVLVVAVGCAYLGGCAEEGEDSKEEKDLKVLLEQRMRMLRDQQKAIGIQELVETYGYQVVPAAEAYWWDSNLNVRMAGYELIRQAGLKSKDKQERQTVVQQLLDYGVKNANMKSGVFDDLLSFQSADYSEAAKEVLQKQLSTSPEYTTILLVGAADVKSALPGLKAIVDEVNEPLDPFRAGSKESHSHAFAALMARARMGIKEDTQRCIQVVEAHPDEEFRVGVLLKRISCVRQPEVVEYLKKYLFMDKVEPGPENHKGMLYAQRAAMALAEMLRGFPGNPEYGGNQETIEQCRKWMAKQKKWDIIR